MEQVVQEDSTCSVIGSLRSASAQHSLSRVVAAGVVHISSRELESRGQSKFSQSMSHGILFLTDQQQKDSMFR